MNFSKIECDGVGDNNGFFELSAPKITDAVVVDWFDSENKKTIYGVKLKVGGEWRGLAVNNKPFFVGTWIEARNKCRDLLDLT